MIKLMDIIEMVPDGVVELYQKYINMISEAAVKKPTSSDIISAINNKYYVGIYYEEDGNSNIKSGFRLIEPYVYGRGFRHPKTGNITHEDREYLRAYVIMSTASDKVAKQKFDTKRKSVSKTKTKPMWRMLAVDRIKSWQTIERKFKGTRSKYNPQDRNMGTIIANV